MKPHPARSPRLTPGVLEEGLQALARRDRDLRLAIARHGPPPLYSRPVGFATLIRIIIEQQLSVAAGNTLYGRLAALAGEVSAANVAALTVAELRAVGIAQQKASYCLGLATACLDGSLKLNALSRMDDQRAREALINMRGIGPWTADVYLLLALRRADGWPSGDLVLAEAARRMKGLAERPSYAALNELAETWRPWRAVAARVLWHVYRAETRKA